MLMTGSNKYNHSEDTQVFQAGAVDSVSAMVYMGDSERAAELAKSENLDTGLHVNFTEPFTGKNVSAHLQHSQEKIIDGS